MFQLHLYKHAHIVCHSGLVLSLFSGSSKHDVVRNNPSIGRNWLTLLTMYLSSLVMISVVKLYDHGCVSWNRKLPSPINWTFCFCLLSWQFLVIWRGHNRSPTAASSVTGNAQHVSLADGRSFFGGDGSNYLKVILFPSPLIRIQIYFVF
jgi:hypothetical protein